MTEQIYKAYVASTTNGVWTRLPTFENKKGQVELISLQWSETDGTSILELEEAKGRESPTVYNQDREDRIASSIRLPSSPIQAQTYFDIPTIMITPLYYKDNGGGGNKLLVKYILRQ